MPCVCLLCCAEKDRGGACCKKRPATSLQQRSPPLLLPVACRGDTAAICARMLQGTVRCYKDRTAEQRVVERWLGVHDAQPDALVYAFTRAGKARGLGRPLLEAVLEKLQNNTDRRNLDAFYQTWREEHLGCRGTPGKDCPIPEYHKFACQMAGEQQLCDDAIQVD